jgi:hypothetical protein
MAGADDNAMPARVFLRFSVLLREVFPKDCPPCKNRAPLRGALFAVPGSHNFGLPGATNPEPNPSGTATWPNLRGEFAMAKTVADLVIERLIGWGVQTIFSLPGDGINGMFEALRTHKDKLKYVQVRHEEAAAFAACGYAKYAGGLGVGHVRTGRNPLAERTLRRQI